MAKNDIDPIGGVADLRSTRIAIVPHHLLLPYRQEVRKPQTTLMQEFQRRLRLLLIVEGSYRKLGKALGVNPCTVLRWKHGKNFPHVRQAQRVDVAYWATLRRIQIGTVRGRRNINQTRFLEKVARDNGLCNITPPEETDNNINES